MTTFDPSDAPAPLAGIRVVENGRSPAGAYCGRLFALYGADCSADHRWTTGPPGAGPGPEADFYDRAKTLLGAVHDPDRVDAGATQRGTRRAMETEMERADVVIVSDAHRPIGSMPGLGHPGQVVLVISPFPTTGPYRSWVSSDLVDAAVAGHLRLSGDPEREPLQGVPDLVHHAAGAAGFVGAIAALIARARTGRGQTVETSHQEVLVALHQFTLCRYTHNGAVLNRLGNRYAGPGSPIGAYRCADGWIGLALPQEDQMERMLEVTGLITMLDRPDVGGIDELMATPGLLDTELVPHLASRPTEEVVELFQALRLPCAPISSIDELLVDEHLTARGFWSDPDPGGIVWPGLPFKITTPETETDATIRGLPESKPGHGPLTGLRVIDMTRVWAGPLASRILADLGAEVLMTEVPWTRTGREVPESYVMGTRFFPDDEVGDRPWNRSCFHNKYAVNKLSTVIELDKPEGRELFAALVPKADLLIENYSPRVMPGFGFDQDELLRLNPDLIYVTMPGYGRAGPRSDWVAYGPTIDGHVGHTSLTGYGDEEPWKCGIAWPDPIGGLHAAAGALVALLHRFTDGDRTAGCGQVVEVAQIEAAVNMIGQHVVAAQTCGPPRRWGNRRPGRAPQGVYRCAGADRWLALSVLDDEMWRALCRVMAELQGTGPGLWNDLAELDGPARWDRHDELDRAIEAITTGVDDVELMRRLQAEGVAAGAALAAPEIMADPQLAAVDFFAELDHTDAGRHSWPRLPLRLSDTPATVRRPAALMGEHNRYAVQDLAGCDDDRYRDLVARGIVRTDPPV